MEHETGSSEGANKENKQANKKPDPDDSVVVTREKGAVEGYGGQTSGDRERCDFGWWARSAMYR